MNILMLVLMTMFYFERSVIMKLGVLNVILLNIRKEA